MFRSLVLIPFLVLAGCAVKTKVIESLSSGTGSANPGATAGSSAPTPAGLEAMLAERNKDLKIAVGKPCPSFSYKTLDGKAVRLGDYAGKALLVDIFSPS